MVEFRISHEDFIFWDNLYCVFTYEISHGTAVIPGKVSRSQAKVDSVLAPTIFSEFSWESQSLVSVFTLWNKKMNEILKEKLV